MDKIRASFSDYFASEGIQLPDPVPPRGNIAQGGWNIRYILDRDEKGRPCLEFIANSRFSNSQHLRISQDGEITPLPSLQDDFTFDPNVPGDREAAEARMHAHNDAVAADLQKKGLM